MLTGKRPVQGNTRRSCLQLQHLLGMASAKGVFQLSVIARPAIAVLRLVSLVIGSMSSTRNACPRAILVVAGRVTSFSRQYCQHRQKLRGRRPHQSRRQPLLRRRQKHQHRQLRKLCHHQLQDKYPCRSQCPRLWRHRQNHRRCHHQHVRKNQR